MALLHKYGKVIFTIGLLMIAIGLPCSRFLMSLGQLFIGIGWLTSAQLPDRLTKLKSNKLSLFLLLLFGLHIIGLINTDNYAYGLNDIRVKLPLLLLPLFITTGPDISVQMITTLKRLFVFSFAINMLIGFAMYFGLFGFEQASGHDLAPFISHIRFAVMGCITIAMCIDEMRFSKHTLANIGLIFLTCLVCIFLILLESLTGIIGIIALGIYTCIRLVNHLELIRQKIVWATCGLAIILIGCGLLNVYTSNFTLPEKENIVLFQTSKSGEKYNHALNRKEMENGELVHINIAWQEIKKSWNQVSELDFNSKDVNGNPVYATLIRFLTSKHLTKDAEGIQSLTHEEISAIENGHANVRYINGNPLINRIYTTCWELYRYKIGGEASGNSLLQRFIYWKIALKVIKEHPFIGVGTGDVQDTFDQAYRQDTDIMDTRFRHRAHNQYLTFWLTFGLSGFLLLIAPVVYCISIRKAIFYDLGAVMVISYLSFLNEDMLETQSGITFFVFFIVLLSQHHGLHSSEER